MFTAFKDSRALSTRDMFGCFVTRRPLFIVQSRSGFASRSLIYEEEAAGGRLDNVLVFSRQFSAMVRSHGGIYYL